MNDLAKKEEDGNRRIFILAEHRSGSSWLMNTLNSHQDVSLFGELYNHATFNEVSRFQHIGKEEFSGCVAYLENKLSAVANRYVGCKILLNQLTLIADDFPDYFIDHYKNAYLLFLTRENMVEAQVSVSIAHAYGIWHVHRKKSIQKRRVRIRPEELYKRLERQAFIREAVRKKLEALDVKRIFITYEELFRRKKRGIGRICDLLNITARGIKYSEEIKGNPFRLEEMIENFQEVRDYLQQYPHYYRMLK